MARDAQVAAASLEERRFDKIDCCPFAEKKQMQDRSCSATWPRSCVSSLQGETNQIILWSRMIHSNQLFLAHFADDFCSFAFAAHHLLCFCCFLAAALVDHASNATSVTLLLLFTFVVLKFRVFFSDMWCSEWEKRLTLRRCRQSSFAAPVCCGGLCDPSIGMQF